jgi:D-alanyl-D-alanine carboxypeptidase/D-alanyl-D-alanine-endopeptidase (penicillin-binding protein 4)
MAVLALACVALFSPQSTFAANNFAIFETHIGPREAMLIADPDRRVLFSKNEQQPLIPASILKVLTALAALHYLGPDFRFKTEFYLDAHSNLKVKGYGDPLLISETLTEISLKLAQALHGEPNQLSNIVLDDSHFASPLVVPGIASSSQPYDAPNGALCANFNTVNFFHRHGATISAEPQTPLVPFVMQTIRSSGLRQGRISLSSTNHENTRYVGHLLRHFLEQDGVMTHGKVQVGTVNNATDTLIRRHYSTFSLQDAIAFMLEHSNNFIANQILITMGVNVFGPPGTVRKGVSAVEAFTREVLGIRGIEIAEGSGISRDNRITANAMLRVLDAFQPYHKLMQQKGRLFYKTGSLSGVRTRAGYITTSGTDLYPFVVMINKPGKSPDRIVKMLARALQYNRE